MRLYLSYRRTDRAFVAKIRDALVARGHDVWWDDLLQAGEAFDVQITESLRSADVVVSVLSKYSPSGIQSIREIELADTLGRPLLFVLIDEVDLTTLPNPVKFGLLVHAIGKTDANEVADKITQKLVTMGPRQATPPSAEAVAQLAGELASEVRSAIEDTAAAEAPKAVFVVHGHDDGMMNDVTSFLDGQGIQPIVLKRLKGGQNTLFDKLRIVGGQAQFAVVLMSADDFGCGLDEYAEATDRALLFRARQNVILETGFFFGKLGWDSVFVLMKQPPKKVPRFERPSDLDGVIFESYDDTGGWKEFLLTQLRARKLL